MLQETNFQHIKVGAHKSSHHNSPVFTKLYLCPTCSQHFKMAITNNVWGWRGVGCGDSSSQGPVSLFDHVKQVHGKEQHYFWAAVPSAAASSPSFFSFFSAPGIPSDIQCSCHETNGMIIGKQTTQSFVNLVLAPNSPSTAYVHVHNTGKHRNWAIYETSLKNNTHLT